MPFQTPSNRGGTSLSELIERVEQIGSEIDHATSAENSAIEQLVKKLNTECIPTPFGALIFTHAEVVLDPHCAAEALRAVPERDLELGHRLIQLIDRRYELLHQIRREVRAQALLRLWLYLHIPLAFGTVTAVIIHIFVVFYYREPRLEDIRMGTDGVFSE